MKKKNISKKVLAVILSFIMIATSVPFGIIGTAAGTYDPAPKFSDEAIKEGARAWLDDDGNVHVAYPAADAEPTYKGEALSIAFYILELVDMGANNVAHKNVVLDTIKVTGTSGTFAAADIGEIDLENSRYSVTVTAVDTENWFSQPLYTTVTDVPVAEIDASRFANFSTSATAVREIMTFDQSDDDTSVVSGNALLYMGVSAEAGTEDLTDNVGDTSALRFIMNDQPSGTQTFDTSMSRQTWDFSNATEVWFWMDLSRVELEGVSFRLRANEKVWYDWGKDQSMTVTQKDYMGDIIYSTKGYTGTDGYVWVQREDGGWNKVSLTNGTVDLGNFKGYVRVPIQFICSENASYAQLKNTGFNNGSTDFATGWNSATLTNGDNHANGIPITKTLVDVAGTNIKDARLMQHRIVATKTGIGGLGNSNYWHFTNGAWVRNETEAITRGEDAMIAAGLSEAEAVSDTDEGYKAIDDLYSAGFAFEGASADSLQNSFFVDNIFFYDENGGPWDENAVSGMASSTGNSMATYYDEELAIAKIIFDEIDKYIKDPDWADYRELEYILELIAEYNALYTSQGKDATFLGLTRKPDTTGLAGMATKLHREDTWEKAWLAFEACATEGTIDTTQADIKDWFISNGDKDDLVPSVVKTLEKLPHPDNITAVSEALRKEIVKLWQAYSLLNLGQLEMLGKVEEETLLKYFTLVENLDELDGGEFIVGQELADNPFIVFNDFEQNYELGDEGYQLEDNKDAYTTGFTSANGISAGTHNPGSGVYTMENSWRHLKNLVTYTTDGGENIIDKDLYGYSPTDGEYKQEVMDNKLHYNASWATITNNGYMNSQGATVYSDSSFYIEDAGNEHEGVYHSVTVTRQGKNASSWAEMQANKTALDGLGQFTHANQTGAGDLISLIFYVDFSALSNFYFSVNVYTKKDGVDAKAGIEMGTDLLSSEQTKADDWNYWILDDETGGWIENNTTNPYVFTSTPLTADPYNNLSSLDNYKGYIRIPLYHFKFKTSSIGDILNKENMLDYSAERLENIFAIQFCIAGGDSSSLDEKSFTIDNVGFTYGSGAYNITEEDDSYAEVFGAKSLPASEFEAAVDAIDPYDETTIDTTTAAARAIYNTLPTYQQNVVIDAYKTLLVYEGYAADHSTIPQPDVTSDSLAEWITNNLTTDATGASVTGDKDLMYPGYVIVDGQVVPNYGLYGLTAELAAQIEEFYNESYIHYTVAEKDVVKGLGFLNAYNAAMRCSKSLEDIKQDSFTFLPEITALYTMKYDYDDDGVLDDKDDSVANSDDYKVGNFVYIGEKNADGEYEGVKEVSTFKTDKYDPLQYYSKTSIDDGTIYPQLTNTSRGFTYFLNNTREFVVDGETIEGGIITFRDKMQNIYDMANDHITNKTLFTDAELQSIRDIINEYNALLPAYYNVEELYELEQAIIRLFPAYQTSMGEQTLMLSAENLSKSTVYTIEYSEYLDITDPYTDTFYVKVVSQNGYMTNDYGDIVSYNVTLKSNDSNSYTVDSSELAGLTEANWAATYPVTNNSSTPGGTQEKFTLTAGVPIAQTRLRGMVTDVLTIQLCHPDGTVLEEQTVQVFYSMGDAYTVTIPAEFPVSWSDSDPQDVSYTANTEMNAASSIKVKVTNDGTGELTNTVTEDVLTYTAENFGVETTFSGMVTDGKQDPAPAVTVSGWDDVPVGEYRTTLTYTVEYDDGTT